MARWPDQRRSNITILVLMFVVFPLLCWLAYTWVRGH
jgi:hypothetical protein